MFSRFFDSMLFKQPQMHGDICIKAFKNWSRVSDRHDVLFSELESILVYRLVLYNYSNTLFILIT
jgi:hypothetical protein